MYMKPGPRRLFPSVRIEAIADKYVLFPLAADMMRFTESVV